MKFYAGDFCGPGFFSFEAWIPNLAHNRKMA